MPPQLLLRLLSLLSLAFGLNTLPRDATHLLTHAYQHQLSRPVSTEPSMQILHVMSGLSVPLSALVSLALVSLALVSLARASFANSSVQARAHEAGLAPMCLACIKTVFVSPAALQPVCPTLTKQNLCRTASVENQQSFEMKQASPEKLGRTLWPLNVRRSQIVATADGFDTRLKWPDPNLTHILPPGHSNCCLACASCARAMDASARGWGRMGRPRHGTRLSEQARLQNNQTPKGTGHIRSGRCSPANTRPSMRLFNCLLSVHSPQRYSVHSTQVAHHNNEGKRGKRGKKGNRGKPQIRSAYSCLLPGHSCSSCRTSFFCAS